MKYDKSAVLKKLSKYAINNVVIKLFSRSYTIDSLLQCLELLALDLIHFLAYSVYRLRWKGRKSTDPVGTCVVEVQGQHRDNYSS